MITALLPPAAGVSRQMTRMSRPTIAVGDRRANNLGKEMALQLRLAATRWFR